MGSSFEELGANERVCFEQFRCRNTERFSKGKASLASRRCPPPTFLRRSEFSSKVEKHVSIPSLMRRNASKVRQNFVQRGRQLHKVEEC